MGLFGRDDGNQAEPQPAGGQHARPNVQAHRTQHGGGTVISETILVDGALSGSGQILVDGRVQGSIDGKDTVEVAARGRVDATIHARVVVVAGRVKGNITADEKIELEPTARVDGDITGPRILIKDGATFKGQVNMRPPEAKKDLTTSSARKNSGDSKQR